MSEPATRPFVSCPHCAWAATTTDPRGAAWLEESLHVHLTRVHGVAALAPRPSAVAARNQESLH